MLKSLVSTLRSAYPFPIVIWDLAVWGFAAWLGWWVRDEIAPLDNSSMRLVWLLLLAATVYNLFAIVNRLYGARWRTGSFAEAAAVTVSWLLAAGFPFVLNGFFMRPRVPMSILVFQAALAAAGLLGGRALWRLANEYLSRPDPFGRKRLVVYGAGEAGESLMRSIRSDRNIDFVPVAVLDDDPSYARRTVGGIDVAGGRDQIASFAGRADTLLIASFELEAEEVASISTAGADAGLEVLVMPTPSEMLGMLGTIDDARPIQISDLLGRPEVEIDTDAVQRYVGGARVLVTGAGGSIGSELARQVAKLGPAKLYMLDRDETGLQQLQLSIFGHGLLNDPGLVLANIRDRDRVFEVFREIRPDVVFHAAALKHLPLLESHPREGLRTNVHGTRNLLDAAVEVNVKRFVNVSTDKAADPTSVLGTTKRVAETLTISTARHSPGTFVNVRFGNVLGSRGSVLPTFERQLDEGGPLTVTHPDVTRYFMSIPEAVRLILQAGAIGQDGETMVLDMGTPVKIVDLAERLIAHRGSPAKIEFTGLRPNEKLHEDLLSGAEQPLPGPHPRITHIPAAAHEPTDALIDSLDRATSHELPEQLLRAVKNLSRPSTVVDLHKRQNGGS